MTCRVKVNRDELYSALKPVLKAYKPSEIEAVLLTFTDGRLVIDLGNAGSSVPAEGEWQGMVSATFRGHFLKAIRRLPKVPEVYVTAEGKTLNIGGNIIRCKIYEGA